MSQPVEATPSRVVIVAAVDASRPSEYAIELAATLGRTSPGAELHLIYVVEFTTPNIPAAVAVFPAPKETLDVGREVVDRRVEEAQTKFGGKVVGHVAAGVPWREIVQFAGDLQADFVVIGTHSRTGLSRLVLGSVAEQVTRKAPCPVLVARPKTSDDEVPEIEPPCPDCVEMQRKTSGETLWCARHGERQTRSRTHHGSSQQPYGQGAMFIRPS